MSRLSDRTDIEQDISDFEREEAIGMIKCIDVMAMFWYDSKNGNTYHSSRIEVEYKDDPEGEYSLTVYSAFEYGYGNHYMTTAFEALEDNDVLWMNKRENGLFDPLWMVCRDRGIELRSNELHDQSRGIVERWGKEPT